MTQAQRACWAVACCNGEADLILSVALAGYVFDIGYDLMRAARERDPQERLNIINGAKHAPLTRRAKAKGQPTQLSDAELVDLLESIGMQRVLAVIAAKQQPPQAA
jgi:hypothetical protein